MSGRLADAIVVARDFLNRHQSVLNQRMSTHPFLVANAGVHSAGVAVFESLGEGALSIEQAVRRDLASSAKGAYDLTCIDIPAAEASIDSGEEGGTKTPDRIIRSVLLRYPTRARILMVDNLNPCWKRLNPASRSTPRP